MSDRLERDAPAPAAPHEDLAPAWADEQRETVVAVFGDSSRSGAWLPRDRVNAVAGFGNVRLDFCEADLPEGATEVRAFAVFGNVELLVPRDLEVELNGVSVFGSIKHQSDKKAGKKLLDRMLGKPPPPPAPAEEEEERWLVVQGWAVFGNVEVRVVDR